MQQENDSLTSDLEARYQESRNRVFSGNLIYSLPLWFIILFIGWALVAVSIATNEIYANIFNQLLQGVPMTLRVAFFAYLMALMIGLVIGLIRANPPVAGFRRGFRAKATGYLHFVVYHLATLYVETLRGLPILIMLLLTAYVIFPAIRDNILEPLLGYEIETRGGSPEPSMVALGLTYGAFISETIRAGIQSIERGQLEAARSLGMNFPQAMWFIILPQAIRRVLPPLGNDIIAMIKDSSLVSALGVQDITQIGRTSSGRSFRYLETYTTVAFIYLTITIIGSLLMRRLERALKQKENHVKTPSLWARLTRREQKLDNL